MKLPSLYGEFPKQDFVFVLAFWSGGKSCIHESMEIDVDRSSIALQYKD